MGQSDKPKDGQFFEDPPKEEAFFEDAPQAPECKDPGTWLARFFSAWEQAIAQPMTNSELYVASTAVQETVNKEIEAAHAALEKIGKILYKEEKGNDNQI